jgi:hypothetical protein
MGVLIEVDWDEDSRTWTVYARPSAESDWSVFDGTESELSTLMSLAHDVATGG